MAYTKTKWVNNSPPYINALHLNKIEQGIYDAHVILANVTGSATMYTKTKWVNNSPPYINALHLNKIEQGIYDAHVIAESLINRPGESEEANVTGSATVAAVANLKSISTDSLSTGEMRYVQGYYVAGDGAGGTYRFDASSTAAANDGTIIAPDLGSGRWVRQTDKDYYHVRWFGARFDGTTNDTAAIKRALDAARDSAAIAEVADVKRVVMPAASCVVTAYRQDRAAPNRVVVHDGLILEGHGYATELKIDPASYTVTGSSYCPLTVGARSELRFFRINGQKASVALTGTYSTNGVYPTAASTPDVTLREMWCHDLKSLTKEGFGLACNNGATGWRWIGCRAYNIDGTGISAAGGAAGGGDHLIEGCKAWSNTWQGIGSWTTGYVVVRNSEAHHNHQVGLNFEFTDRVEVYRSTSRDNVKSGTRGMGSKKLYFDECVLRNNNTSAALYHSEVNLGAGGAHPVDGVTRHPERCEFHGGTVEPRSGGNHIYMDSSTVPTEGPGFPQNVALNTPGAQKWFLNDGGAFDGKRHPPGVRWPAAQFAATRYVKDRASWTVRTGATLAAYSSGGNENPGAFTISSTGNGAADVIDLFAAYKAYLLVIRVKQVDTANWRVQAVEGGTVTRELNFPNRPTTSGQWHYAQMVVPKSANRRTLRVKHNATGSSSLVVDYATAYELSQY